MIQHKIVYEHEKVHPSISYAPLLTAKQFDAMKSLLHDAGVECHVITGAQLQASIGPWHVLARNYSWLLPRYLLIKDVNDAP